MKIGQINDGHSLCHPTGQCQVVDDANRARSLRPAKGDKSFHLRYLHAAMWLGMAKVRS